MQAFSAKQACRLPQACQSWWNNSAQQITSAALCMPKLRTLHEVRSRQIERRQPFYTQASALHRQTPSIDKQTTSLARRLPSSSSITPLIVEADYTHRYLESPVTWIESLDKLEDDNKVGLVTLSPNIWFQSPRIDVIFETIKWQTTYKKLLTKQDPVRSELKGGTKKPWPQKGTGRARFKDNRGPGWQRGGVVWGMRGPRSYYYMLPKTVRVKALISALSIKYAQDDLHVVDSFDSLPTNKSEFLEALAAKRNWGLSVLFVDDTDIMPPNIAEAAWNLESFTLMPVYGLNVHSILKHETLVITLAGLRRLEERLKFFHTSTFTPEASEKDKIHNTTK